MINKVHTKKVLQKIRTEEVRGKPIHTVASITEYIKEGSILVVHQKNAKWVTFWYSEELNSIRGVSHFDNLRISDINSLSIESLNHMQAYTGQQIPNYDGWWRLIHSPDVDDVTSYEYYKIVNNKYTLGDFV